MTDRAAAIALLAGNPGKRQQLARVLGEFGYAVVFADDPAGLTAGVVGSRRGGVPFCAKLFLARTWRVIRSSSSWTTGG